MIKSASRQLVVLAAVLAATAVPAAPAAAASPLDVIRDCLDDGILQGSYPSGALRRAQARLRGDAAEYSDCKAIIGAQLGAGGPKAGAASADGGGSGADLDGDGVVTAAERRAAAERAATADERRQLASIGDSILDAAGGDDGSGAGGVGETSNGMPTPILLALIALALLAAAGGTWYAAQRHPAVGNALRRVPLPTRRS